MSDERRRVLDLLAQGKITVDEADHHVVVPTPVMDLDHHTCNAPSMITEGRRLVIGDKGTDATPHGHQREKPSRHFRTVGECREPVRLLAGHEREP